MEYQRTYEGLSANQILTNAAVSVMQAGVAEITHPRYPGAILVQDADGDLVIANSTGPVVKLICGKRAAERLQHLADAADAKNWELWIRYQNLKAELTPNTATMV